MPETGKLSVRVYTSRAEIPVSNATVVVTRRGEEGRRELLTVQATDSSGMIRPITVDAPPGRQSTYPDPGQVPFTVCDVWAEHPGYTMLMVEGVQIFPGVESLQAMELTPLSEGESSLEQTQVREIPAQNL